MEIIGFFGLMALMPTVMAVNDWRVWYMLWRYGTLTEARIQYHWEATLGLFKHYYLIYEFEVEDENGNPIFQTRYTEVERDQYFSLMGGEPLMVNYASNNPRIFRLENQSTSQLRWTLGAVAGWAYVLFMASVAL